MTKDEYFKMLKRKEEGKTSLSDHQRKLYQEIRNTDLSDIVNDLGSNKFLDQETLSHYNDRVSQVADKVSRFQMGDAESNKAFLDDLKSLQSGISKASEYYSTFKDENDFNSQLKTMEQNKEWAAADTKALKLEVDTLKTDLEEAKSNQFALDAYKRSGVAGSGTPEEAKLKNKLASILKKYGYSSIDELEAAYGEKKQYYNNASRYQDKIALHEDAYNAEDFEKYSKLGADISNPTVDEYYGGFSIGAWRPFGKDAGNKVTYSRDNYDEALKRAIAGSAGQPNLEPYGVNELYTKMTDDEVKIYNYYLAKEGEGKADQFLESITESLTYRQAEDTFEDVYRNNAFLEGVFGLYAGLDQWVSGVESLFNTEGEYVPQSATQMMGAMAREDLTDDYGIVGQGIYDLANTTGNMLPSILLSSLTGNIAGSLGAGIKTAQTIGKVVGAATLGSSAAGNGYQEMLNLGYDKSQAQAYGTLVGLSEAGLGYALGGITSLGGKFSGGITDKIVTKLISNVDNAIAKVAIGAGGKLVGSMISEFGEEYLQEVLDPVFKNITLNTDEDIKLFSTEALYSGILGALSAGLLEGGSTISGEVATYRQGKSAKDSGQLSNLKKFGTSFSADTVAYKIASQVDENTDAYTIGQLLHEVGADSLSEANMADIVKSLERKGIDSAQAETIAKWLNKAVEGGYFTPLQRKALENPDISQTFKDVIINENSTVNQRMQSYTDILQNIATEKANQKAAKAKAKADKKANKTETSEGTTEEAKITPFVPYSSEELAKRQAEGKDIKTYEGKSIPTTEKAIESKFETNLEGKTVNVKTGEDVNVTEIASIDNGKMTLKLENGETVDADDISFGTEDEALVYSAVLDMGVNAAVANSLVKNYNPSEKLSAQQYALGIKEAYKYGSYGMPINEISKNGFAADLTEAQRTHAYNLGKVDMAAKIEKAQAEVEKVVSGKGGIDGKVYFKGDELALKEVQRESLKRMGVLSEVLGVDFHVFESYMQGNSRVFKDTDVKIKKAPNGFYKDGKIYIDLNAGKDGQGVMIYTVAHELTHFIREWSPAKFKILADFLMEQYGKEGQSVNDLVQAQIDKAKRNGRTIDYDTAYEEVVADSMETMLADDNVIEKILELKSKDESIVKKIGEFFAKIIDSFKKLMQRYSPESVEGKLVANMKDAFTQLQDLFAEALVDAGNNYQANNGQKNTTSKGDVKNSFRNSKSGMANDLLLPYDNELSELIEKRGDYIIDSFEKLKDVVNLAFDKPQLKATTYFGIIPAETLSKIEKSIPNIPKELNGTLFKDGKTYSVAATLDSIKHLADDKNLSRKDIIEYLDRMADTIIDFDTVNFDYYYQGSNKSNGVIFKKTFEDGTMRSFEIVSNKKKTLNLQTLYMESGDYQKNKSAETLLMKNSSANALGAGRSDSIDNIPQTSKKSQEKRSDRDKNVDIDTQINQSMTMDEAKQMIQRAFVLGEIQEWYDGEYKNGDEWLRAQGADEVAMYIENEYTLQEKYINKIQGIIDDEFFVADVLEAYLKGTLVGKEKPKANRLDVSVNHRINDTRFYSPQRIENVKELFDVASQKLTSKNRAEVSGARAKILLFAHNKGASELLGLSQSELNKKLRSWSGYTAGAREISEKLNKGVAESNKWTGIENCSWLYKSQVTTEELESLVKSVEGAASDYEKLYIARTMLALDTHIDWSWLSIEFDSKDGVNKKYNGSGRCNGFYNNDGRKIVSSHNSPDTIAHEMGHALDYQWGRDLGFSHSTLTDVYRNTKQITDADTKQFFDNFKIFLDSLTDNGDIRSEYTQDPKEVFARFIARFIQWVDNTGTGHQNYNYEYSAYKDNFTASHYIEFVKLLQEKAMLDSKKMAEGEDVKLSDRDTAYMEAVNNGDMETAQRLVEEAAKEAGYNSPTLYHGTPTGFGFTVFDASKVDDKLSFFATNDERTAKTYSGETNRRNIMDRITVDVDNASPTEILELLQKHIDEKYQLVSKDELEKIKAPLYETIRNSSNIAREFILENSGAFNDEKRRVAYRIVNSISAMADAETESELDGARASYQDATWELRAIDSSIAYELLDAIDTTKLFRAVDDIDLYSNSEALFTNGIKTINDNSAWTILSSTLYTGVYSLYGNTDGMLEIDANGANWNRINTNSIQGAKHYVTVEDGYDSTDVPKMMSFNDAQTMAYNMAKSKYGEDAKIHTQDIRDDYGYPSSVAFRVVADGMIGEKILVLNQSLQMYTNTRGLARYAKDAGYNGVKISNLKDSGGAIQYNVPSDIYIFFNSSQMKSADPVTYDDDGNVIPLSERFNKGNDDIRYSERVTDEETLDYLNEQIEKGEYIKVYRSFQVIDGGLYAPMNAVDRDENGKNKRLGYRSEYGVWEKSTESPEIAQRYMDNHPEAPYAKFDLDGVDNKTNAVAYNPYLHASNLVLNDQFSAAYRRNLITVECYVPLSEAKGEYKAQYAKDATGWVDWKAGGVAGKLLKVKPEYTRKLFVSRYMLPVRQVPDSEVAAMYKEYLDGTDIAVPWNVVTPSLRNELEKAGVAISYDDAKAGSKTIRFNDVFSNEVKFSDRDSKTADDIEKINQQLAKENVKLIEDVKYLKELVKLQSKETHGKMLKKSTVELVAKRLMAYQSAKGNVSELTSLLTDVYNYIIQGEDVSWEGIQEKSEAAVDWLMRNEYHKPVRDEYANTILKDLRTRRVSLDEKQKAEVAYKYGSFENFRKKNMGRIIITNDGLSLDSAWQELAEMYPSHFDKDVSSNDQPIMLMEIIDGLQNTYEADDYHYYSDEMVRQDLMTKIYEGYWDVSALHTVADAKQKEINLLKAKHRESMDALKESHKESDAKLRQEHRERIAQLRTQYREREEAKVQKVAQYYQKSRKEAIDRVKETREKRDAVTKLQRLVLDTAKWVSYPAKDAVKCPDIIRAPYAEFLSSIDLTSKRALNGGEPTKNDLRVASAMDSLAKAIEKKLGTQSPDTETETVLDTGYLDLPVHFVENLKELAESLKKRMVTDGHIVNSMTSEEVKELTKFIRTLNHSIKEMSTLYANMRFARVEQLGNDSMVFLKDLGEYKKSNSIVDFVTWDNALPYYTFKRFGVAGESVFEELMDAQDKQTYLAKEIFEFKEKTWTDKEANEWSKDTHTIELPSGREVTLTSSDAMSIYCLSRREQGRQHLLGGGVRVLGIEKNGKKANDSRSLLNQQDLVAIASSLTERQKQVAEAIQEFMSTVCAEWGNEISMKRFLTKEFTEKYYFPIESNDENLDTKDPKAQQSDLYRLLNISATKPLVKGANNEVIIRNIFDVFANHSSDMSKLNAYGMALLDYMKWINYREKTVNDDGQISVSGVRKSMEKAYGPEAAKYVIGLIKDINGRFNDNGDNQILMKMLRGAKTAMVGANLRVAVLQVTAYPRAAMVLSPKSLALGLTKIPQIEKAKKYCGIALRKSYGFYDTNITRSLEEQFKGAKNIRQRMIELSLKGAEWGDAITWGALWNACEYEVAKTKKYKVGSEAFNQAVGKKLREVVYATQVVDSTLTRSQMMRSKSGLTQTASAFMSEPTLSANILMDAGFQFNLEKRRTGSAKLAWQKTSKYVGRAVAVYSIGQIFVALAEALMDAYRDDDDEEFKDKFGEAFIKNAASDLTPFNKIPIIADVSDLIMSWFGIGFSSSNSLYLQAIDEASNAFDTWSKVINGEDGKTVYAGIYSTTKLLSYITGVSASGAMREAVALWNFTAGQADPYLKVRTYESSATDKGIAEYNFDKNDTAGVKTAVSKMVNDKIKSGKTEKEAKSAVRSSFTSTYKAEYMAAVKNRDYDEMNRIRKFLYATGLYGTLSELDETLKKWRTAE